MIRYPKNAVAPDPKYPTVPFQFGTWKTLVGGKHAALLAVGSMVGTAIAVAAQLREAGRRSKSSTHPRSGRWTETYLGILRYRGIPVFSLEEHVLEGGFGSSVLEYSALNGTGLSIHPIAVRNRFVPHGDHKTLIGETGLDADTVARKIRDVLTSTGR